MNRVVVACAGAGKTTALISSALAGCEKRVLIVTYTINNYNQIIERIFSKVGHIPGNVRLQTWFSFLLEDGVRPNQSYHYDKARIRSINFVTGQSPKWMGEKEIEYYISNGDLIYSDRISAFICKINHTSGGKVIRRLEGIYDAIYIDEIQDLAGYDLCLLELLFRSSISMYVVGDCRQATYSTNKASKNKRYRGEGVVELFKEWEKKSLCSIEYMNNNYRGNQSICDFSDLLHPEFEKSVSCLSDSTNHDGVFLVSKDDVHKYVEKWKPVILRYNKDIDTIGHNAYNFGAVKGLTYDRVLIFPTDPIKKFLKSNIPLKGESKAKFYVAVTRAKYSVTFVYDGSCCHEMVKRYVCE